MWRKIMLRLAGFEEVPAADVVSGLEGYQVPTHYTGIRPYTLKPGEQVVGRTKTEGATEIRYIIDGKNDWLLVRRRS